MITARSARGCCALLTTALVVVGCRGKDGGGEPPPPVAPPPVTAKASAARAVTKEIAFRIEAHIAQKTRDDGGRFLLEYEGKTLRLELVRVHLEYLARLGPNRDFACVDLVDVDGEVYDVDFFLEGPPGAMQVVETSVHKLNGRPFYAWEQRADKTWHRVAMAEASTKLQDVIEGTDQFTFLYEVTLPDLAGPARMWIPLALSDAHQDITMQELSTPGKHTIVDDAPNGNRIARLDLEPSDGGKTVRVRYDVTRREKSPTAAPLDEQTRARLLAPDRLVPITDEIRALGAAAVAGKTTEIMKARALYDHVMDRMSYKKVGAGWGEGDATYACDSKTGNCSDYHAYFIAVARSVEMPARFAVGVAIPSTRDAGDISGYHCWAEIYADGKWWPVDVSEGDKYTALSTYYFGHHPANRLELSRGRDLVLDDGPASGPINFLVHPLLEVEGKIVRTKAHFSFDRTPAM